MQNIPETTEIDTAPSPQRSNEEEVSHILTSNLIQQQPWIVSIDNIFLDIAKELKSDEFLIENGIKPGSQNTAFDFLMREVATKILTSSNEEMAELSRTAGGCAMNTSRAANYFLNAREQPSRVLTMGSIGQDLAASLVIKQL